MKTYIENTKYFNQLGALQEGRKNKKEFEFEITQVASDNFKAELKNDFRLKAIIVEIDEQKQNAEVFYSQDVNEITDAINSIKKLLGIKDKYQETLKKISDFTWNRYDLDLKPEILQTNLNIKKMLDFLNDVEYINLDLENRGIKSKLAIIFKITYTEQTTVEMIGNNIYIKASSYGIDESLQSVKNTFDSFYDYLLKADKVQKQLDTIRG